MQSIASVSTPALVANQQITQPAGKSLPASLRLPARKCRTSAKVSCRRQVQVLAQKSDNVETNRAAQAAIALALPALVGSSAFAADYDLGADLKASLASTGSAASSSKPAPAKATPSKMFTVAAETTAPAVEDDAAAKAARVAAAKALKNELNAQAAEAGKLKEVKVKTLAQKSGAAPAADATPVVKKSTKAEKVPGGPAISPLLVAMLALFSPLALMLAASFQTGARLISQLGDK